MKKNKVKNKRTKKITNNTETLAYFARLNELKKTTLLRKMVEYEIIDETYYPYDNYTTWFAVRWPYPTSPEKYLLSVTPAGQNGIIDFVDWLLNEKGINLYK